MTANKDCARTEFTPFPELKYEVITEYVIVIKRPVVYKVYTTSVLHTDYKHKLIIEHTNTSNVKMICDVVVDGQFI